MFDFVEKHKRLLQIFLGLIAVTFATWGIESYTRFRGGADTIATVNGLSVSQREFELEMRRQQERLRRMLGGNFDPAVLERPESRRALLDSLVTQRLLASEAQKASLIVSDDMLVELIHSVPAFQSDGRFSKAQYEQALRMQNPPMSSSQFEQRLRYDLVLQQLTRAVGESAIAPRSVAERLGAIEAQQREVAEVRIAAQQFVGKASVDDAKLKEYYGANPDEFRTPERVRAEFVMISADALAAQEPVTPQEAKAYWDATYGPKVKEREDARKKAQSLLAAVRKDPASFAQVAKAESQDPGSKDSGGDLGFSPRGAFVKPFEDALFRMKEGAVSDLVETEFGFHIIKLTAIQRKDGKEERRASHILITAPADAGKPFEALRPQIEAELKKQRGARKFAESAEAFSNLVYEQPDSLKPAAERFKLQVQTTPWIAKSASQELGALDNPKLLAALFSQDSIKNKRNTDAIEVAPGALVAARVLEHQPAVQRSFDEVKKDIGEKLRRKQSVELVFDECPEVAGITSCRNGTATPLVVTSHVQPITDAGRYLPRHLLRSAHWHLWSRSGRVHHSVRENYHLGHQGHQDRSCRQCPQHRRDRRDRLGSCRRQCLRRWFWQRW